MESRQVTLMANSLVAHFREGNPRRLPLNFPPAPLASVLNTALHLSVRLMECQ